MNLHVLLYMHTDKQTHINKLSPPLSHSHLMNNLIYQTVKVT